MVDAVLTADAVDKDFDRGWAMRPVNTSPLSVKTRADTPSSEGERLRSDVKVNQPSSG